jgi:CBS domain-containing protein
MPVARRAGAAAEIRSKEAVMKVSEAMSNRCETVKIKESLQAAARHMRDADIGMLFVEDENGEFCGVLTDRDIAVRAVAAGVDPKQEIQACITNDLISCHEDDSVEDAAKLMEREQVRRLLVRDASERPVGVLAQADLARVLGRSDLVGEVLHDISRPGGKHSQH